MPVKECSVNLDSRFGIVRICARCLAWPNESALWAKVLESCDVVSVRENPVIETVDYLLGHPTFAPLRPEQDVPEYDVSIDDDGTVHFEPMLQVRTDLLARLLKDLEDGFDIKSGGIDHHHLRDVVHGRSFIMDGKAYPF